MFCPNIKEVSKCIRLCFVCFQGILDNSLLIGQVQMRQHRITSHPCNLPLQYLIRQNCRGHFTEERSDTQPYGTNDSYWFIGDQVTGAGSIQGKHGKYSGDGYLVRLENNRWELTQNFYQYIKIVSLSIYWLIRVHGLRKRSVLLLQCHIL